MDIKEEEILGESAEDHWYYRNKARALQFYLAGRTYRHILDVGAGSGFFSKWLLTHGVAEQATCVDSGYGAGREDVIGGKEIRFVQSCQDVDADLVLFMDVLEHVDDDAGLITGYMEKIPAGATVFFSVPAFPFLWSSHDVFLEHRRRYTVKTLKKAIASAGLEIKTVNYYFGFVFPLVAAVRLAERLGGRKTEVKSSLTHHSSFINGLLDILCRIETPLVKKNRYAGLSLFSQSLKK